MSEPHLVTSSSDLRAILEDNFLAYLDTHYPPSAQRMRRSWFCRGYADALDGSPITPHWGTVEEALLELYDRFGEAERSRGVKADSVYLFDLRVISNLILEGCIAFRPMSWHTAEFV